MLSARVVAEAVMTQSNICTDGISADYAVREAISPSIAKLTGTVSRGITESPMRKIEDEKE